MENVLNNIRITPTSLTWDVDVFTKETANPWGEELASCQLFVINQVPIIAFYFSVPEQNFFIGINYAKYSRCSDDWMKSPILYFTLKLINSESEKVLDYKVVKFSPDERNTFIEACKDQIGTEPEFIDASIDFLYDNDFSTYGWLY